MGQMIDFARPDGGTTSGYLASAGDGAPGMILIQEWWGLKPHIKEIAEQLASAPRFAKCSATTTWPPSAAS